MILGLRRDANYVCALLGCYAACGGNYRRFGTTCWSCLKRLRMKEAAGSFVDCWPLKMGPIACPETSVRNYHSALHNAPEECRSQYTGSLLAHKADRERRCEIFYKGRRLVTNWNWRVAVGWTEMWSLRVRQTRISFCFNAWVVPVFPLKCDS